MIQASGIITATMRGRSGRCLTRGVGGGTGLRRSRAGRRDPGSGSPGHHPAHRASRPGRLPRLRDGFMLWRLGGRAGYRRPVGARPLQLPQRSRGSDRANGHRPEARTQEDARAAPGNGKTSTTPTWHTPCWQPAIRGVAERRPAHRTGGSRGSPAGWESGQHRLALACPYPRGLGWGDVRPSGRGAGHVPGWPGARAFATGLVSRSCSPPPAARR